MTAFQDKWLTKQRKAISKTKAQMKKAANAEKKIVEKQDKAKAKNQILEIRQLALNNRQAKAQLGSFKDILSDLSIDNKCSQSFNDQTLAKDLQPPPTSFISITYIAAQLKNVKKKKTINHFLFD